MASLKRKLRKKPGTALALGPPGAEGSQMSVWACPPMTVPTQCLLPSKGREAPLLVSCLGQIGCWAAREKDQISMPPCLPACMPSPSSGSVQHLPEEEEEEEERLEAGVFLGQGVGGAGSLPSPANTNSSRSGEVNDRECCLAWLACGLSSYVWCAKGWGQWGQATCSTAVCQGPASLPRPWGSARQSQRKTTKQESCGQLVSEGACPGVGGSTPASSQPGNPLSLLPPPSLPPGVMKLLTPPKGRGSHERNLDTFLCILYIYTPCSSNQYSLWCY